MPSETAIQDSLPTTAAFQSMTVDQKRAAIERALKSILMAIHEGRCTLGNWEKISIGNALMMFDRGLYSAAMHEVACALWPKDNRSPNLKISARTASRTLDEFDRELERLMQRPD